MCVCVSERAHNGHWGVKIYTARKERERQEQHKDTLGICLQSAFLVMYDTLSRDASLLCTHTHTHSCCSWLFKVSLNSSDNEAG